MLALVVTNLKSVKRLLKAFYVLWTMKIRKGTQLCCREGDTFLNMLEECYFHAFGLDCGCYA